MVAGQRTCTHLLASMRGERTPSVRGRINLHRSSVVGAIASGGVATVLGMALLLQCGTTVQAAPSATVPHCSNIQLAITPPTRGLGAALGHVGRWYRIRDVWGGPCSLRGFPGVVLLDRNFRTLPVRVQRYGYIISGTVPIRKVVLDRKHSAYFALEYQDVPSGTQPCRSVPYLMVTPPNDSLPVVTHSGGIAPCPRRIDVSSVEPAPALH